MKKINKLNSKGFTHVETAIVVVVIAVIAVVGFVVYNRTNNKSKAGTALVALSPQQQATEYQKLSNSAKALEASTQTALQQTKGSSSTPTGSTTSTSVVAVPGQTGGGQATSIAAYNNYNLRDFTVFTYPECNTKNGKLNGVNYSYRFGYNSYKPFTAPNFILASGAVAGKGTPGYFMLITQGAKKTNLVLSYKGVSDGYYYSKAYLVNYTTATADQLSNTPVFTPIKYKNLVYSPSEDGNTLLASEVQSFTGYSPNDLKEGYAKQCENEYLQGQLKAQTPTAPATPAKATPKSR